MIQTFETSDLWCHSISHLGDKDTNERLSLVKYDVIGLAILVVAGRCDSVKGEYLSGGVADMAHTSMIGYVCPRMRIKYASPCHKRYDYY